MTRVLHIVRSRGPDALPATAVAPDDVLVYTYVPAPLPARAWFLWRDQADRDPHAPATHVPILDTAAVCQLVFDADRVVVW